MSVLEEVLLEEYDRSLKIKKSIEIEQKSFPKGSIQKKIIHDVECYYLVYRDGEKIRSKYINKQEVDEYRELIERRRDNEKHLRELRKSIKMIEKALGKETIYEHTAEGIY